MDPLIRQLTLKGYRSFRSETVEFDNPTFFVGRNGSGKSNLLDALAFLAEAMASPLQAVFDRRGGPAAVLHRTLDPGGPPALGLSVTFGEIGPEVHAARYAFEVRTGEDGSFDVSREQCLVEGADGRRDFFDRGPGGFRSNIDGVNPVLEPTSLGLPVVGGAARFAPVLRALASLRVYSIQPSRLREAQHPDPRATALGADGSNVALALQQLERRFPEDLERINELLPVILPGAKEVKTVQQGHRLTLELTQEWGPDRYQTLDVLNLSDGTLRAVALLTAVYQRPTPSLIAIEEPEDSIHPGALGAVLDILRHASRRTQLVVTTHSPDVLDAEWLEDRHLRIVSWQAGATHVAAVSTATRDALHKHLMSAGELLRSNALRAQRPAAGVAPPVSLFEEVQG